MTTSTGSATVDWMTADEAHDVFESRSQQLLGLSRIEFLAAYGAGNFSGREEEPGIRDLLALLPLARAV